MRDALHDKVDAREALVSDVHDIMDRVKAQFADVFEASGGDIGKTLEGLAVLVEHELTDLTTKAVQVGADGTRKARASK